MIELLPCPFCGGRAEAVRYSHQRNKAYCADCEAETSIMHDTQEDAIAAWNRRAAPAETKTPITEDAIVQLGFVHNNGTLYRLPTSNPACAVIATFFPKVPCVVTIMNHHGDATIWLPTVTTMERLRMLVAALSTE